MYVDAARTTWEALDSSPSKGLDPSRAEDGSRGQAEARRRRLPVVRLHGVDLHAITESGCIDHIMSELDAGRGGVVVTPNLDHLRRCTRDMSFMALVAEADLVVADGMPLVWASRLQGTPLPERVAGSDLISSLSAAAHQKNRSIYLLGGTSGTAEGAGKILVQRHANLKIAGWMSPEFGFEKDDSRIEQIGREVGASGADIVYVALGSPKQEMLIGRIRKMLPNAWWLGVGNSFSFLCGDVRRAPLWMQRCGLEWTHRLLQEPKRLFKRYLVLGLPFAGGLIAKAAAKGVVARWSGPGVILSDIPAVAESKLSGLPVESSPARGFIKPRLEMPEDELGEPGSSGDGVERLSRLRALVLLGGSVRPTPLSQATQRSILDLPLDNSGSLLSGWMRHAAQIASRAGLEHGLPVRVLVNQTTPEPVRTGGELFRDLRIERDRSEYRGTGGVLGDLAADWDDDDLIIVASAAQVMLDPLVTIVTALGRRLRDVGLIAHSDHTPTGVMLFRCAALRLIPRTGFVDMKEQALPQIARRHEVSVLQRRRPTGLPVRTLRDYILALRQFHRLSHGSGNVNGNGQTDPLAEDWQSSFAIIEPGAVVDPQARVHDSVVLEGARVEQDTVLVRSVIAGGTVLRRGSGAMEEVVVQQPARRAQR